MIVLEYRRSWRGSALSWLLAVAGCGVGCSKPAATTPAVDANAGVAVTVSTAVVEPLDLTLPVVGTLFAKDEAMVSAEVEGKVEKTAVEFGDRVKVGQELALIDTTTYSALASQAAARVAQAAAAVVSAEHDLARQRELRKNGIASPSDLDAAVAAADSARAAAKAAEASETVARLNLDHSHVRVPFDAAVAERIASAGDYVKAGAPLFRIVNDAVLKFIVAAPESYAPIIRKEQVVRFSVDAYPGRAFEGKVYLISPQVTAASRMFSLGALVPNGEGQLKAGTFARGEVVLQRDVPTVLVPLEAVVVSSGIARVYLVTNRTATVRPVSLGRVFKDRQEISTGLSGGETVVTSGQSKLREGARVVTRP